MNRSAELVADVPTELVTVTSTAPTPAGLTAVIVVGEATVTEVARAVPKCTVEPLTKSKPVIVTNVPPTVGPAAGLMEVTTGAP